MSTLVGIEEVPKRTRVFPPLRPASPIRLPRLRLKAPFAGAAPKRRCEKNAAFRGQERFGTRGARVCLSLRCQKKAIGSEYLGWRFVFSLIRQVDEIRSDPDRSEQLQQAIKNRVTEANQANHRRVSPYSVTAGARQLARSRARREGARVALPRQEIERRFDSGESRGRVLVRGWRRGASAPPRPRRGSTRRSCGARAPAP